MLSHNNFKPLVISATVGAAIGFSAKLFLDSSVKTRSSTGLIHVLNNLTLNALSRISEKTGTKESNVSAFLIAFSITGVMFRMLRSNDDEEMKPMINILDHETSGDRSPPAEELVDSSVGTANIEKDISNITQNNISDAIISSEVVSTFFINQQPASSADTIEGYEIVEEISPIKK